MRPDRKAAWQAYLALTNGLLPAVRGRWNLGTVQDLFVAFTVELAGRAGLPSHERRQLIAVAGRALHLHLTGDTAGSVMLLQTMARRLFLLSAAKQAGPGRRSGA